MSLSGSELIRLYIKRKLSVKEIVGRFGCSENKINYWLKKHNIPKRSISEAVYQKANPSGDPYKERFIQTKKDAFLQGLGLGLYWGEGTKKNKHSVRLGNSDPALIRKFIEFLERIYQVDKNKLRFGLQIFSDMNPNEILIFWMRELGVLRSQFHKPTVTPSKSIGTYRERTKYGVLTVYFFNKKLRDDINGNIEQLR